MVCKFEPKIEQRHIFDRRRRTIENCFSNNETNKQFADLLKQSLHDDQLKVSSKSPPGSQHSNNNAFKLTFNSVNKSGVISN